MSGAVPTIHLRNGQNKKGTRKPAEVLLVENNSSDIRLMQEAFRESARSRLHVARDGEQALAFLQGEAPFENSPRPAYILLDLNLPNKGGWEVLAEIKHDEHLRHIPVLVFSTSTGVRDVARAYALHANAYVSKPADLDDLIRIVKATEIFWLDTAALVGEAGARPSVSLARPVL